MFAWFDLSALFHRRSAKFALAFLAAVVAVAMVTFTARAWRDKKDSSPKRDAAAVPPTAARKANVLGKGYIERRGIWPQLHSALDAYGDRLEKPGKERLIAVGTLSNTSTTGDEKVPVRLVSEFPDKLRIEKQKGNKIHTTIFDGKEKVKIGDTLEQQEEEELDALAVDSIDHFMAAHMRGKPMRFLGDRFRLDDSAPENYSRPFYDIYQISEQEFDANNNNKETIRHRLYFFNSDTHRLERITYKKGTISVAVELAGWRKMNGQVIPTTLTRLEDGRPTITLTISTLALMPRANDGAFSIAQK